MSVNATASDITLVNTYVTGSQQDAAIAALPDGGWIATWMSAGQDGSGGEIYQQRFDASGIAVGGEIQVNTMTESSQLEPSVSGLDDGGWVVAWTSYSADSDSSEVFMQRYDSNGTAVDGEVQVNTYITGSQGISSVTGLSDGGYVVAWASPQNNGLDVFVQRYDSQGTAIDGETLINTFTSNYQLG
jgi:hypothetical protein